MGAVVNRPSAKKLSQTTHASFGQRGDRRQLAHGCFWDQIFARRDLSTYLRVGGDALTQNTNVATRTPHSETTIFQPTGGISRNFSNAQYFCAQVSQRFWVSP